MGKDLRRFREIPSCGSQFYDALTAGYQILTNQDIAVEIINGVPNYSWRQPGVQFVEVSRRTTEMGVPAPAGYSNEHFAWQQPFSLKTPKGYSVLICHPMNRFDLPFMTTSGIVDADGGMQYGSIPFFAKDGWEGIIPAGTPIAQVIPFKRDSWKAVYPKKIGLLGQKLI